MLKYKVEVEGDDSENEICTKEEESRTTTGRASLCRELSIFAKLLRLLAIEIRIHDRGGVSLWKFHGRWGITGYFWSTENVHLALNPQKFNPLPSSLKPQANLGKGFPLSRRYCADIVCPDGGEGSAGVWKKLNKYFYYWYRVKVGDSNEEGGVFVNNSMARKDGTEFGVAVSACCPIIFPVDRHVADLERV